MLRIVLSLNESYCWSGSGGPGKQNEADFSHGSTCACLAENGAPLGDRSGSLRKGCSTKHLAVHWAMFSFARAPNESGDAAPAKKQQAGSLQDVRSLALVAARR